MLDVPFTKGDNFDGPSKDVNNKFLGLTVKRAPHVADNKTVDWLANKFPDVRLTRQDYYFLALCIERYLRAGVGTTNLEVVTELNYSYEQAQSCSSKLRKAGCITSVAMGPGSKRKLHQLTEKIKSGFMDVADLA